MSLTRFDQSLTEAMAELRRELINGFIVIWKSTGRSSV